MSIKADSDPVAGLIQVLSNLRQGRPLALFLDYDGTLVNIAPRPEQALPDQEMLELLGQLTVRPDIKVTVVSGRPLHDLQNLLPVPGLNLVASHGGEVLLDGLRNSWPLTEADREALRRWQTQLKKDLRDFDHWWLEDKPLGFALHFRQVARSERAPFLAVCRRFRREVEKEQRFQVLTGKMVLELLPLGLSKGAVLKDILSSPGFIGVFALYLGDDQTDESAFALLRRKGLAVRVGRFSKHTHASHFLPAPRAVKDFLRHLASPPKE